MKGAATEFKRYQIIEEISRRKIKICAIQETKTLKFTIRRQNGLTFIIRPTQNVHNGLGFTLDSNWESFITEISMVNGRIAILK